MARTRNSDTARLERRLTIAIDALRRIAMRQPTGVDLVLIEEAGRTLEKLKVNWKGQPWPTERE